MNSEKLTLLGIDTSGRSASCAVFREGTLIAERTFLTDRTHSEVILPTVTSTLEDCKISLGEVDIYACAAGPGSYTGLRIGIAAIKGLCALGKPCIGVSTLEAMACNVSGDGYIIPVINARPGVIYFGGYKSIGESAVNVRADAVGEEEELCEYVKSLSGRVILSGDCAKRLKEEYFSDCGNIETTLINSRVLSAAGVCRAALANISEAGTADSLGARYLQNTMAEKLRSDKKK